MARKWEYRNTSIKVWMHDNAEVAIHYQGTAAIEKKTGTANKFRLFIDGTRVMPDGSKISGTGVVVLPSGTDWKYECHHLASENAAARVLLLTPDQTESEIRKVQIVLPIDADSPSSHSKAFADAMETCANRAKLEDGAVIQINLDQLFGALNHGGAESEAAGDDGVVGDVVAEEITAAANFLAAMDPFLFGSGDSSSDEEEDDEEDWN